MTIQLALPGPQKLPEHPILPSVLGGHSRRQAIEEGLLVDVSADARGTGFTLPVAITTALDDRLLPSRADEVLGQQYAVRLWEALWLAAFTLQIADAGTSTVTFTLSMQEADPKSGLAAATELRLRAVLSPGDAGEPVVTIGLPEES